MFRHPQHLRLGYPGDGLLVLKDEILGIAEVFVQQQPVQRFAGTVEVENEAIQNGIFGGLKFLLGHLLVEHLVQFFADRPQSVHGVRRLRAPADLEEPGMIVLRAPTCIDSVGVSELGANALEQAAREASA